MKRIKNIGKEGDYYYALFLCKCGNTIKKHKYYPPRDCGCGITNYRNQPGHKNWEAMKSRCLNPRNVSYYRYGARGITIDPVWRVSFEAFIRDMGPKPTPKHTIDRINSDLGYNKANCRWATMQEQADNRRRKK